MGMWPKPKCPNCWEPINQCICGIKDKGEFNVAHDSKPRICKECRHCIPGGWPFTSSYNWDMAKCRKTEIRTINYVTGNTEVRYEFCKHTNTIGTCSDWEPRMEKLVVKKATWKKILPWLWFRRIHE